MAKYQISSRLQLALLEDAGAPTGKVWRVVIIEAGVSANKNYYSPECLQAAAAAGVFEGRPIGIYEFRGSLGTRYDHVPGSVRNALPDGVAANVAGWLSNVTYEESVASVRTPGALVAALTADMNVTDPWLRNTLFEAWNMGKKDLLELSIEGYGPSDPMLYNGEIVNGIQEIAGAEELTVVTRGAAGGHVTRLVASAPEVELETPPGIPSEISFNRILIAAFEHQCSVQKAAAILLEATAMPTHSDQMPVPMSQGPAPQQCALCGSHFQPKRESPVKACPMCRKHYPNEVKSMQPAQNKDVNPTPKPVLVNEDQDEDMEGEEESAPVKGKKKKPFPGAAEPFAAKEAAEETETVEASPSTNWSVGVPAGLPLAGRDAAWNAGAVKKRITAYCTTNNTVNFKKFAKFFLLVDDDNATTTAAYKMPIADVVAGKPTVIPRGMFAAAGILTGGGVDASDTAIASAKKRLASYYAKADQKVPWTESSPITRKEAQMSVRGKLVKVLRGLNCKESLEELSDVAVRKLLREAIKAKVAEAQTGDDEGLAPVIERVETALAALNDEDPEGGASALDDALGMLTNMDEEDDDDSTVTEAGPDATIAADKAAAKTETEIDVPTPEEKIKDKYMGPPTDAEVQDDGKVHEAKMCAGCGQPMKECTCASKAGLGSGKMKEGVSVSKPNETPTAVQAELDELRKERQASRLAECKRNLSYELRESGLTDVAKEELRLQFPGIYEEADLKEAIERTRRIINPLIAESNTPAPLVEARGAVIAVGADKVDRMKAAVDVMYGFDFEKAKQIWDPKKKKMVAFGEAEKQIYRDLPTFVTPKAVWGEWYDDREHFGYERHSGPGAMHRMHEATTVDLPNILGDSMTRVLIQRYQDVDYGLDPLCEVVPIENFKLQQRLLFGGFGYVPITVESDTINNYITMGFPADAKRTFTINTYGGIVAVTRRMIIDDDLQALQRIPTELGTSCAMTLAQYIMSLIQAQRDGGFNTDVSYDGITAYSARHNNTSLASLDYQAFHDSRNRLRAQRRFANVGQFGANAGTGDTNITLSVAAGYEQLRSAVKVNDTLLANGEKMTVVATTGTGPNDITVSRAAGGTVAIAHTNGDRLEQLGAQIGLQTMYSIVSDENEATALQILGSEKVPGSNDNALNTLQPLYNQNRIQLIHLNDMFLNGSMRNWFNVAAQCAVLGFLGGQRLPQFFIQDQPYADGPFLRDTTTWKCRHEYAGVIKDHKMLDGNFPDLSSLPA